MPAKRQRKQIDGPLLPNLHKKNLLQDLEKRDVLLNDVDLASIFQGSSVYDEPPPKDGRELSIRRRCTLTLSLWKRYSIKNYINDLKALDVVPCDITKKELAEENEKGPRQKRKNNKNEQKEKMSDVSSKEHADNSWWSL